MAYDFDDFLSNVKYLDKQDILDTAYKNHKLLDKHSSSITTAQRMEFQRSLSNFLYWLETEKRPDNISDQDFTKFKFICDNLVKKQQLGKQNLLLFK